MKPGGSGSVDGSRCAGIRLTFSDLFSYGQMRRHPITNKFIRKKKNPPSERDRGQRLGGCAVAGVLFGGTLRNRTSFC